MKKLLLLGLCGLLLSGCDIQQPSTVVVDEPEPELVDEAVLEPELTYEQTISFVDDNITEIVTSANFELEPVNGTWFADGYGFTSQNHVYVDFEDGHFLFRALLECEGAEGSAETMACEALAFFEPTGEEWKILQGEDTEKDNPIVHEWAKDYDWER